MPTTPTAVPTHPPRPTQRRQGLATIAIVATMLAACGGGGDDGSPAPSPAPSPSPAPAKVYRFEETLTVDSRPRTFTLNLPPSYYETASVPLVIAMHGGGGSGTQFESTSLLTPKADAAGFAVVYPDGTAPGPLGLRTWNGGGCCGYAVQAGIDDVAFMRGLIVDLTARYKIDPKRIYATGHSNGGIMSYRLACDLADRIAAIAPNAAAAMATPCAPSRPVPVRHMHSRLDTQVRPEGGFGTGIAGVSFPSLAASMATWVSADACPASSQTTVVAGRYTREQWTGCAAGATVEYYLTDDGGHAWPGGLPGRDGSDTPSTAIDANDLLLEFFARHRLP